MKTSFVLNDDFNNTDIFKRMYPKSITITHRDYVLERCSKRKLFIYGSGCDALRLAKYLSFVGIQVDSFIDDTCVGNIIESKPVISSIDLVYEEISQIFLLVTDEKESYGISRMKLINLGMREDVDFTFHSEISGTKEPFYYDVTLSYNRVRENIEGFELFGDIMNPHAVKIVALGGSTTESTLFYIKGWVQFLAEYLIMNNISAVVYCGGTSGYTSTQELLKFIRDVIPLNPDIVISYSGANDLYMFPHSDENERYKKPFITRFQVQFLNQISEKLSNIQYALPTPDDQNWKKGGKNTVFYGLQNTKTASEFWIDNMRMIHSLSREFGIRFLPFFQPFRFNGYYTSTSVQEIIHSRRDPSCTPSTEGESLYSKNRELNEVRNEMRKYKYIIDLSEIFSNEQDVYYDSIHVYEKGNKIIAQRIFEILLQYL